MTSRIFRGGGVMRRVLEWIVCDLLRINLGAGH